MKEEHRLEDTLQQIDQAIVTPNVRELVRDDGAKLGGRKSRRDIDGEQHDGPQAADDGRYVDQGRLEYVHRMGDAQASAKLIDLRLPVPG
jgi:hypothetical protein